MTRKKLKEQWVIKNGPIPDGFHLHHIIPIHNNGPDTLDNLELLTIMEHAIKHKQRYEELGDFRDLCAYYLITADFYSSNQVICSGGGKIGGRIVFENKKGIFRSEEERIKWAKMGGKVAGKKAVEEKTGIHNLTDEERFLNSSKGGKKGALTMSHIQSENGKRGGIKNKGFRWYTDGTSDYKYTTSQQKELPFEQFLEQNEKFRKGRKHEN